MQIAPSLHGETAQGSNEAAAANVPEPNWPEPLAPEPAESAATVNSPKEDLRGGSPFAVARRMVTGTLTRQATPESSGETRATARGCHCSRP